MRKLAGNAFFCFSPPIMIATFLIEVLLAFYVLIKYKTTRLTQTSVLILLMLGLFQLSEFNVCGGRYAAMWARVGFVAISVLPILGLKLVYILTKRRTDNLLRLAYITALLAVVVFVLSGSLGRNECGGNYAIFHIGNKLIIRSYLVYYFGWLITGITMALYYARRARKYTRRALCLQVLGYAVFLVPTAITAILQPGTLIGLPSIMCGFAVIYALIITFGILPSTGLAPKIT
jgi:hypothetical protein